MQQIEIHGIAGAVKDLAWDSESKRIVAVGEGGMNMRAFTWDTGNNLGELVSPCTPAEHLQVLQQCVSWTDLSGHNDCI